MLEQITGTASEAYSCLSIGATRGAVALARSVVESTAKAKDIDVGGIQAKVKISGEKGHNRSHVRDAAEELRAFSNTVAHGDLTALKSLDRGAQLFDLCGGLIGAVSTVPNVGPPRSPCQANGAGPSLTEERIEPSLSRGSG